MKLPRKVKLINSGGYPLRAGFENRTFPVIVNVDNLTDTLAYVPHEDCIALGFFGSVLPESLPFFYVEVGHGVECELIY